MKDKIEQEQELLLKREELRILRQQEAEDKKWRKQELVNIVLQWIDSNDLLIGEIVADLYFHPFSALIR